jgi:hypothetical protein
MLTQQATEAAASYCMGLHKQAQWLLLTSSIL